MRKHTPNRKQAILLAAQRLFADKGYYATPTAEIAATAGVAQGTLFYHFKNKEGILLSLFQETTEEFLHDAQGIMETAPDGLQALLDLIECHLDFCANHQEQIKILLRDIPADVLQQNSTLLQTGTSQLILRLQSTYKNALEQGIADRSIRSMDAETMAWITHSCIYGLIKHIFFGTPAPDNLRRETLTFFRHSLASNPVSAGVLGGKRDQD